MLFPVSSFRRTTNFYVFSSIFLFAIRAILPYIVIYILGHLGGILND